MNKTLNFKIAGLLALILLLLPLLELSGQSFIKPMGKGLNSPVNATCIDTMDNIYTVTSKSFDTLDINYWNSVTGKWSLIDRVPQFQQGYFTTCNVLNGKFYLTGWSLKSKKMELREYSNGGSWKTITGFSYPNFYVSINSIRFNNKLYFVGGFDSVGGVYMPNVFTYDGDSISSAGFPVKYIAKGLFQANIEIIADSLFITGNDQIILHTTWGKWQTYLDRGFNIRSIAAVGHVLYATAGYTATHAIIGIKNGQVVDSLVSPNTNWRSMKAFKNKLFLISRSNYYYYMADLATQREVKPIFKNQYGDTGNNSFMAGKNKLYCYASSGLSINNYDHHNIIEIIADSVKGVGYDTIIAQAFVDNNRNYQYDAGDQPLPDVFLSYLFTNVAGQAMFLPLENEDMQIAYLGNAQTDSCLRLSFTGSISSKCFNSPRTRDTLLFPFRRLSVKKKNLINYSSAWWGARLDEETALYCNIFNKDCDPNKSSAQVTFILDNNTIFVQSWPPYTSRKGNEITFDIKDLYPFTNFQIGMRVIYPSSKYAYGQTVRHYTKITTDLNEDTANNSGVIDQKLVYSYDPNAKHSIPEGRVTRDLSKIRYHIEFQNEGNDEARTVTVVDTLNLKLPVYEFQMIGSSHPYTVSARGNVVTWIFNNINLRPKSESEEGSKGYLIFEGKLRKNLGIGDSVLNKAYIYFDYNDPIETKPAVVKCGPDDINFKDYSIVNTVKVFPNPASKQVTLQNKRGEEQHLTVYDVKGARVSSIFLDAYEIKTISIETWAQGIYLMVNEFGKGLKLVIE